MIIIYKLIHPPSADVIMAAIRPIKAIQAKYSHSDSTIVLDVLPGMRPTDAFKIGHMIALIQAKAMLTL